MTTHNKEVMYIIQINVPQNKHLRANKLINQLIADTAKEQGVLHYHWSINGDGIQSIEHFTNSTAALSHLLNFQKKFADEYMSLGKVVSTVVYGNPSTEVKKILDGFDAVYRQTIDSM